MTDSYLSEPEGASDGPTGAPLDPIRKAAAGLARVRGRHLLLLWMDVRAGLYVRSAVPCRTRVTLAPEDGAMAFTVVLEHQTTVAVYRQPPRWAVDATPWQVVVVVGPTGPLATGRDDARIPAR